MTDGQKKAKKLLDRMYPPQQKNRNSKHDVLVKKGHNAVFNKKGKKHISGLGWALPNNILSDLNEEDDIMTESFIYSNEQVKNQLTKLDEYIAPKSIKWGMVLGNIIQDFNSQYQHEEEICKILDIKTINRGPKLGLVQFVIETPERNTVIVTCNNVDDSEYGAYDLKLSPDHWEKCRDMAWSDVGENPAMVNGITTYGIKKYLFE